MKPNFGLSIVIGALFSTFVTSIYILMSTVPALIGNQPPAGNPLGDAIVVWLVLTGMIAFGIHEWQKVLEEYNKRGREEAEEREKREREEREKRETRNNRKDPE